ncbi:MAG TPA: ABC transporter ATP-binding protein [Polyangiaceae bacterium]|nr:ABC transporter ATP-binding protein [Polyangiaceae bacterium]
MIEIQELYKYYGDRRAIGPLSTSIAQGEVVGLLGLNGAGKTTTLRVLACDLLPTSGTVRVAGFDVVERPDDVRAKVGYLPDRPPLYEDMTVREYLGYAARLRNVPTNDVKRRVSDVFELTEIGNVGDQLIGSLSHGFRQRVGIAQSIVHGPELVVLDEPISGLDPVQIMEMRELVRGLRGAHTVVVSSHILTEISETCDRILVIDDGKIAWSGTEAELSATLKQGMRVSLTLRAPGVSSQAAAEKARATLTGLDGVREVEVLKPAEAGEGIASLRVAVTSDVRDAVCRRLVEAGLGILELSREKELESMFLELLGEGQEQSGRKRRKKKRADAEAAAQVLAEPSVSDKEPA